ncbi:aspartate/glutamate racemase family protein [Sphingobium sp. AR-3-1]|uniref:Aspartate/glutamate racemase family protein n=2 Tax=Sphingobium psychrophilum TaxID=2728834 RepID=A0A7X9ZUL0_9SPHN|nr:aspartate/glutamate racemase family protein [Sphingobium psychrophilum]
MPPMFDPSRQAGEKLGILGGMGPLATVDFLRKIIERTPGQVDQDHIPVMVHSVPQIPDRSTAFLNASDAPWSYLLSGLYTLQSAGARLIAIPCNTAHVWHARLSAKADVEVAHIGRVTTTAVLAATGMGARVGVLATDATLRARIYHNELEWAGMTVVEPQPEMQETDVMTGIRLVKAGQIAAARDRLTAAARGLIAQGADAVVMACTEIPIALEGVCFDAAAIDPTAELAQSCVDWWANRYAPVRQRECEGV